MRLRIPKPDDSRTYYDTNIRCNTYNFINNLQKYMDNLPEDAQHFYKTYMNAYK